MSETNGYEYNVVITSGYKMKYLDEMPEDVQKRIREYIEMVKAKYNPDGTLKNVE